MAMKPISLCLLLIITTLVFVQNVKAQEPTLFPLPSVLTYGSVSIGISPSNFSVTSNSKSPLLWQAINRYANLLLFPFKEIGKNPSSVNLVTLTVTVISNVETLQLGVDESYTLSIPTGSTATLTAQTVFGAMRGLETFSQLVQWNFITGLYSVLSTPVSIQDKPRFAWRGLMIDTARHFLNPSTILHTIDAMSYSKYNTLHIHAVDAQSFPIMSKTYPQLAEKGAYAPTAIYSISDLQEIVDYAFLRGIRVVLEVDVPGHSAAWGKAFPNITAYCPSYMGNINNIPLDPTNPFTYEVLEAFLSEMAQYFPDQYLHTGGDELVTGCWLQDSNITAWMKKHGMSNPVELEQYFENALSQIIWRANRTMVTWQDPFNNGVVLPKGTIIEVWSDPDTLQSIVNAGYQGLQAYGWYLDRQIPDPPSTHYEWVDTWLDFWNRDPLANITTNKNLVIGGEAVMFGEQVDSSNFDSRVWPRACAQSERLWAPQNVANSTDAKYRLIGHRCRLAQRGVGAGPIAPDYCPMPF